MKTNLIRLAGAVFAILVAQAVAEHAPSEAPAVPQQPIFAPAPPPRAHPRKSVPVPCPKEGPFYCSAPDECAGIEVGETSTRGARCFYNSANGCRRNEDGTIYTISECGLVI